LARSRRHVSQERLVPEMTPKDPRSEPVELSGRLVPTVLEFQELVAELPECGTGLRGLRIRMLPAGALESSGGELDDDVGGRLLGDLLGPADRVAVALPVPAVVHEPLAMMRKDPHLGTSLGVRRSPLPGGPIP